MKLLDKLPKFVGHVYALITVIFGWWLFVFTDFSAGLSYLGVMFGRGATGLFDGAGLLELASSAVLLVILAIAATPWPRKIFYSLWEKHDTLMRTVSTVLCAAGFLLCVAYLVNSSFNPFLYYRF